MLDSVHSLILRSVADGDQHDSPALQTLIATGLVERAPDGRVAVTPAGRAALREDEDGALGAWPQLPWVIARLLVALMVLFMAVNLVRGDRLLGDTQLAALPLAGVALAFWVVYLRRAARRAQAGGDPAAG